MNFLKRTVGWWMLPIAVAAVLLVLALLGDAAPVRFLVYSVF